MFTFPVSSFLFSYYYVFVHNVIWRELASGLIAIVCVNIVIFGYVLMAYREGEEESKQLKVDVDLDINDEKTNWKDKKQN